MVRVEAISLLNAVKPLETLVWNLDLVEWARCPAVVKVFLAQIRKLLTIITFEIEAIIQHARSMHYYQTRLILNT